MSRVYDCGREKKAKLRSINQTRTVGTLYETIIQSKKCLIAFCCPDCIRKKPFLDKGK